MWYSVQHFNTVWHVHVCNHLHGIMYNIIINSNIILDNYVISVFLGVYFRFQVTGMIEWGQKSKPKKMPCRISEP